MDALAECLSVDCEYVSEYAGVSLSGADNIIARMKSVASRFNEEDKYTYQVRWLSKLLNQEEFDGTEDCGLLLYRYSNRYPVAIVTVQQDKSGESIKRITLSRDSSKYNLDFYRIEDDADYPEDKPSTVKSPASPAHRAGKLQSVFSGQHPDHISEKMPNAPYVWKKRG